MIAIRPYDAARDAHDVGILIADTFFAFNLGRFSPEDQYRLLGPYAYARSEDPTFQAMIAEAIAAEVVFVAEDGRAGGRAEIVGVLRGRPGRVHSLFVDGDRHGQGIGRRLMEEFEEWCRARGVAKITLAATPYAVAFYQRLGYKKSTGMRSMRIFGAAAPFPYQPMKKVLG